MVFLPHVTAEGAFGTKDSDKQSARDPNEQRAVQTENRARDVEGIPERTTYGGEKINPNPDNYILPGQKIRDERKKASYQLIIKFISMKRNLIIINIIILLSCFMLSSCNKSNIHIDDKIIKEIASIDDGNEDGSISYIPDKATNLLYLKLSNGKIMCTNALELRSVYVDYYKENYKTFYAFLTEALNQRININPTQIQKIDTIVFDLEKNILNKSNDMIEKEYFEKNSKIYLFYPKNVFKSETKHTIQNVYR